MKKIKKLYACECQTEGLTLEYNNDWDDDKDTTLGQYYLSIWTQCNHYHNGKMPWKNRLYFAWKVLYTGELWSGDNIILDKNTAEELSKDLLTHKQ
jgi:hypothetical protein